MLRIEFGQLADGPTATLQGRFVGDWAEQAKSLFMHASVPAGLVIDLREVTYVDSVGEEVLVWFRSIGATFVAENSYSLDACERLHLPRKEKANSFFRRAAGRSRSQVLPQRLRSTSH
jgi:hypothetical protein